MPDQKIEHNPTSKDRERQSGVECDETMNEIVSMLSSWPSIQHLGAKDEPESKPGVHWIISVTGTNIGATMRGQMMVHHNQDQNQDQDQYEDHHDDEVEESDTYVNSNCQGVNNSIMIDASYTSCDPGVHANIEVVVEPHE